MASAGSTQLTLVEHERDGLVYRLVVDVVERPPADLGQLTFTLTPRVVVTAKDDG